ncbi:MAG: non-ribosomal peptide synthetase, partial [Gammaproteobacteria bacterium]|nr:non-ribosomal peptide synthetase [Gammaproteobacteria bacterium]
RICDEQGKPVMTSEAGEIQVRGSSTMRGYVSVDDNQSAFDDQWFRTGDLGYLDERGYLYLTGRLKDIINRGGEKISPAEIDSLALNHPSIVDAACFPVKHPSLGEDVTLALVVRPGENVSQSDIKAYLREQLAYFKVPDEIHFVDDIPRYNGKLRRHNLAEEIIDRKPEIRTKTIKTESMHSPLTMELISLWSEVLETEDITPDSDFFFLGGDSLSATILVNKINDKWEVPILVSAIYDAPVLQEFENHLTTTFPGLPKQFNK